MIDRVYVGSSCDLDETSNGYRTDHADQNMCNMPNSGGIQYRTLFHFINKYIFGQFSKQWPEIDESSVNE